jgi:putative peptidoglycan lipid II flippase
VALVHGATAADTSPALVAAYGASYAVGSGVSYLVLRRSLGGLETPTLVRFLVRLVIAACLSTLATAVVAVAWDDAGSSHLVAAARLVVLSGVDGAIFLVLARLMRIGEVTEVLDTFTRRLPGRG